MSFENRQQDHSKPDAVVWFLNGGSDPHKLAINQIIVSSILINGFRIPHFILMPYFLIELWVLQSQNQVWRLVLEISISALNIGL